MKILLFSYAFAPSIGGIETVSLSLAKELIRMGQEVRVVTQTLSKEPSDNHAIDVLRRPSNLELIKAISWSDIVWHNNLGLRSAWPLLFLRRQLVITHAGSYCRKPNGFDFALRLKHFIVNRTASVAISKYVANFFGAHTIIIPNPFENELFVNKIKHHDRPKSLMFLGRLATEKGCDILLESLARLKKGGIKLDLTIVGTGPEFETLGTMVKSLNIEDLVHFAGAKRGQDLVDTFNQHKILVVPSRFEAFGVAVLEGISCGCVVVGTAVAGLPETIGSCGVTFPNGDAKALAEVLERLLSNPQERDSLLKNAPTHLAGFHATLIAASYLKLFQSLLS